VSGTRRRTAPATPVSGEDGRGILKSVPQKRKKKTSIGRPIECVLSYSSYSGSFAVQSTVSDAGPRSPTECVLSYSSVPNKPRWRKHLTASTGGSTHHLLFQIIAVAQTHDGWHYGVEGSTQAHAIGRVYCSVLQCVAVRCSTRVSDAPKHQQLAQCVAVCGSVLQCVEVRCSTRIE